MTEFPHGYLVRARAEAVGPVQLETEEGLRVDCFAPRQFGGEAGEQSPEYLLTEAVAGCFVLTFRAIAQASRLAWQSLSCTAVGQLDKVDGKLKFTGFSVDARLQISDIAIEQRARALLAKAEQNCLITASLNCPVVLEASVEVV